MPPKIGATIGASDITTPMMARIRAARSRPWTSITVAVAIAMLTPPPKPCTIRAATSIGAETENQASTLPATYSVIPAISAGRRPNRSERGPNSSAEVAETRRYPVTVSRMVAESVANSAVMSGIDGRNMSIDSGARAARATSIAVVRCDSARPRINRSRPRRSVPGATFSCEPTRCPGQRMRLRPASSTSRNETTPVRAMAVAIERAVGSSTAANEIA